MTDVAPDTGTDATTEDQTIETETAGDTPTVEALQAELDKWKSQARKHEDRAKANAAAAKELEQVRAESMTEQERAVAEASAKARAETLAEVGGRLAASEVRVAAAGRLDDEQLAVILDSVDLTKFLMEDGQVDTDRVRAFVDGITPKPTDNAFPPDLGQGARGGTPALGSDPLLQALKNTVGSR